MITDTLKVLFNRDLEKLKTEIQSYKNEETIWHIEKSIANSAGNLCLHLIGNLNAYIGAEIGKTGYIRNRDLEFSQEGVLKLDLIKKIEETREVVNSSLDKMTSEQLESEYSLLVFKEKTSTEYFLIHLTGHLTYHLGQINYHRRLLDN